MHNSPCLPMPGQAQGVQAGLFMLEQANDQAREPVSQVAGHTCCWSSSSCCLTASHRTWRASEPGSAWMMKSMAAVPTRTCGAHTRAMESGAHASHAGIHMHGHGPKHKPFTQPCARIKAVQTVAPILQEGNGSRHQAGDLAAQIQLRTDLPCLSACLQGLRVH